jgi:hypothetical protein
MNRVKLPKLFELQHIFATEEAALRFYQEQGILLKPGITCDFCNVRKLFSCKPKVLR